MHAVTTKSLQPVLQTEVHPQCPLVSMQCMPATCYCLTLHTRPMPQASSLTFRSSIGIIFIFHVHTHIHNHFHIQIHIHIHIRIIIFISISISSYLWLPQSILSALKSQIPAKADIKATLSMYKYLDNVSKPPMFEKSGSCLCLFR